MENGLKRTVSYCRSALSETELMLLPYSLSTYAFLLFQNEERARD